jgi:capsular polysaccharide transport system permease protein
MNCFLGAMYPLWNRFWAIATRPLFLVSCIFMLYETVPEPYQSILWYNPLVHVCGQMRKAFFPFYDAVYVSPAYVFGVSLVLMVTGLIFLQRYHREMRER